MKKFPDLEKLNILNEKYEIVNPDIMKAFFGFMVTVQKTNGRIESYLSRFKTTTAQISILLILYLNNNEPETPGSLSKKLGLSGPTISNVLKTLGQKKFIKKAKDENDQRISKVSITEEGYSFLDDFLPGYYEKYEQLFSNFESGELQNLKLISLKLFHNLDTF